MVGICAGLAAIGAVVLTGYLLRATWHDGRRNYRTHRADQQQQARNAVWAEHPDYQRIRHDDY